MPFICSSTNKVGLSYAVIFEVSCHFKPNYIASQVKVSFKEISPEVIPLIAFSLVL